MGSRLCVVKVQTLQLLGVVEVPTNIQIILMEATKTKETTLGITVVLVQVHVKDVRLLEKALG